jgi:hypothetical protein
MGWFIIMLTRGNLDRKVVGLHEAALGGCAVVKGSHGIGAWRFVLTSPATPPRMRVCTGLFDGLRSAGKFGTPSRLKRSSGSAMLSAIAELCHQRRLLAATRLAASGGIPQATSSR